MYICGVGVQCYGYGTVYSYLVEDADTTGNGCSNDGPTFTASFSQYNMPKQYVLAGGMCGTYTGLMAVCNAARQLPYFTLTASYWESYLGFLHTFFSLPFSSHVAAHLMTVDAHWMHIGCTLDAHLLHMLLHTGCTLDAHTLDAHYAE